MKLSVHGFEPLLIDMRVNLRRRNIRMAEHFLDNAQVGAVAKEMRRETVPEKMGIDIFLESGVARMLFYNLPAARGC